MSTAGKISSMIQILGLDVAVGWVEDNVCILARGYADWTYRVGQRTELRLLMIPVRAASHHLCCRLRWI